MATSGQNEYAIADIKNPMFQMAIILMGAFMAVLDTSVVNVAIPAMESALSASTTQIQWVLTGYTLVLGILVPISGWLTDRFGSKRLFIFALATFTMGSALCGMAWNLPSLIFFRVIQASGGGIMMPVAMAMIYRIFPPNRRGFVMGLFGIVIMAAPAFGPLLSGWLVDYASWRLIFYINVPIGVIGTILSITALYDFPHQVKADLDHWGVALTVTGFFSLLYGFSNVSAHGWNSPEVMGFIVAGTVLIGILVVVELNHPHPLIELRVMVNYMFSMSLLIASLVYVALFVGIFLMPLYLQDIMGYTAMQTGEFMTPAALGSAVMMVIGGRLFDKVGARPLGIIGLAVLAATTYGFTRLTPYSTYGYIQTLYIIRSLGMGLTMMPIMTAGMNTVPVPLINQASGVSNTVRQTAASLGTAILTSYMAGRQTLHFVRLSEKLTPFSPQGIHLTALEQQLAQSGMGPAKAHAAALLTIYTSLHNKAFVLGLDDVFWISTLLAAMALALTFFFASAKERAIRLGHAHHQAGPETVVEM